MAADVEVVGVHLSGLSELHRQGILNDELLGKALDYLKSHPDRASDEGSTGSSRSRLQPGTPAGDGSVYL